MSRWLAPLTVLLVLGACATPPPPDSTRRPSEPPEPPTLSKEAQRALAKRGMKQHDVSPLTVSSHCNRVDEIGTATRLKLDIGDGEVSSFDAEIVIKGRGRCHFALTDFRQETRQPQVLLRHTRDSKCTVRMWREQTEQVTIAFNSCPKACEGQAFTYLWPILVETKTGQCF